MANRKVKRNTSKQIISYTLDPEGRASYGTVKFAASKTVYGKNGFNKVLYTPPTELVNAEPSLELTIINEEKLDLRNFTGFKDEFSARYELPPNDKKYYSYNQSYESATKPYGSTNLGFSKVVFGPPQASPGTYTITKELIDSGNDLKLTYQIRSFDRREPINPPKVTPSTTNNVTSYFGLTPQQATVYLDRYEDLRRVLFNRGVNPRKGNYTNQELMRGMQHWYEYGGPNPAFQGDKSKWENRYILFPVGIDTRFQRIRKSLITVAADEANFSPLEGIQNTVTNDDADVGLDKRPEKSEGFNHSKTIIIKNQDMKEFDEWQIAGSCGTSNNDEVGYLVESSFWDIELISN